MGGTRKRPGAGGAAHRGRRAAGQRSYSPLPRNALKPTILSSQIMPPREAGKWLLFPRRKGVRDKK